MGWEDGCGRSVGWFMTFLERNYDLGNMECDQLRELRGNFVLHSRQNPMGLTVALDDAQLAAGHLYWDDGVRIGMASPSSLPKTLFIAGYCQGSLHPWGYSKPKLKQTTPNPRMWTGERGSKLWVEGMDLAKAISGGQIWTHLQRQNWNETCRPTSQKHDPSWVKPQHAVIDWINVLYKWTCALGWGKAGNQDSSSKPVGTITTDHVRALTDFLNMVKFKLSAGETHWAGISPPHPQEHYPSNNSEFPPGMQEMCLAWGPGGSLQEAGGGSGGASHPLPALESRKDGHV